MADVAANLARLGQAHHGVHVGTVNIDLTAVIMGDLADFLHGFFKHTMGRRIGDHAGRKIVGMLLRLGAEIGDINVTFLIRDDRNNLVTNHLCRSRVGAVGRGWDQADVAVRITARSVVAADGQQAGIFTLRPRVGLLGDRVIAGDLAELVIQIVDHRVIAHRLIFGAEGVQVAELGPSDRDHLDGGVQLHGAGPQRDHRAVQRQIAVGETAHVARHLGLGAVAVEGRVSEVFGRAQ